MNPKDLPPPPRDAGKHKRLSLREFTSTQPVPHRTRASIAKGEQTRQFDELQHSRTRMQATTTVATPETQTIKRIESELEARERAIESREQALLERERYLEECENMLLDEAHKLSERAAFIEQMEEDHGNHRSARAV